MDKSNPTNIELRVKEVVEKYIDFLDYNEDLGEMIKEIVALLPTSKNYPHDYIRKNQDERKA